MLVIIIMSFTRNMYDSCSYSTFLSENKSAGNYALYPGKYYSNNQCRIEKGLVGGNNVSLSRNNLVDVESDLKGQTRRLSDCPSCKYKPKISNCARCNSGLPCGCGECQQELLEKENLPRCNIIDYNQHVLPDNTPTYKCNFPY